MGSSFGTLLQEAPVILIMESGEFYGVGMMVLVSRDVDFDVVDICVDLRWSW